MPYYYSKKKIKSILNKRCNKVKFSSLKDAEDRIALLKNVAGHENMTNPGVYYCMGCMCHHITSDLGTSADVAIAATKNFFKSKMKKSSR